MRRVAALAAIVVLLLVGPLAGTGTAAPRQGPATESGGIELRLDQLDPRVVTADGPTVVTITGTLSNTGEVPVDALGIRLQRSTPLDAEGEIRDALDGEQPTDATSPRFQDLPDALAAGESVSIRLAVPLRGAPETTLALTAPGVYELLVNVNGVPEGGDRARLAAVRMLLPVVSLPPGADGAAAVPAADVDPSPFAVLFPVIDVPRRLATVPGEATLLSDDELATSFTPQGRLGGLVEALATSAPAGSAARDATCVVVDPDLLQTAALMGEGYEVTAPGGQPVPGTGAEAATAWLQRLTTVLRGTCVLALPFADADVVALTRHGLAAEAVDAVTEGRALAGELLGTTVLPSTAWPADGVLDEAGTATLSQAGTRSLVLSADGVDLPSGVFSGVVRLAGEGRELAVVADPLLTAAATGGRDVLSDSTRPRAAAGAAAGAVAAGGALSTQDVLGVMMFRLSEDPPESGPLLLAPPRRWPTDSVAAGELLDGIDALAEAGLLTPVGLGDIVSAGITPDPRAVATDYPLAAGTREITAAGTDSVRGALAEVADLRTSVVDDERGVDTEAVFLGLVSGAVRPASAAWRGEPDLAVASGALLTRRIDAVRSTLRVVEPPGQFSLGSSSSPLLLTVTNGLPVTMRVRLQLSSTSGLRVAPIPDVEVPPLGRRQVTVNAEVIRAGVFTVQAEVLSLAGEPLGPASRLQVRSTAYGTITVWLTGTAAVLLVVLVARRILRRVRRRPQAPTTPEPPIGPAAGELPGERTVPVAMANGPATNGPATNGPGTNGAGTARPPIPDSRFRQPVTAPVGSPPFGLPTPGRQPSNAPIRPGPRTGHRPPGPSSRSSVDGSAPPLPGVLARPAVAPQAGPAYRADPTRPAGVHPPNGARPVPPPDAETSTEHPPRPPHRRPESPPGPSQEAP